MFISCLILADRFAVLIVEFGLVTRRWGEEGVKVDQPSTLAMLVMVVMVAMMVMVVMMETQTGG